VVSEQQTEGTEVLLSEIRVGDLVMVVAPKACCGSSKDLGHIYRVERILGGHHCSTCGRFSAQPTACLGGEIDGMPFGKPLARLKRIPPLTEPEHITEEATA
jgi:hypothetical protein